MEKQGVIITSAVALMVSAAVLKMALGWKSTGKQYSLRRHFFVVLEDFPNLNFTYISSSMTETCDDIKRQMIWQAKAYNSKQESTSECTPHLVISMLECRNENGEKLDYRIPLHSLSDAKIVVAQTCGSGGFVHVCQ